MIKDAIIRISLSRCDEVPSLLRSDSGKLDPISFGRKTRHSESALDSDVEKDRSSETL